jgi:hypothetical protein
MYLFPFYVYMSIPLPLTLPHISTSNSFCDGCCPSREASANSITKSAKAFVGDATDNGIRLCETCMRGECPGRPLQTAIKVGDMCVRCLELFHVSCNYMNALTNSRTRALMAPLHPTPQLVLEKENHVGSGHRKSVSEITHHRCVCLYCTTVLQPIETCIQGTNRFRFCSAPSAAAAAAAAAALTPILLPYFT